MKREDLERLKDVATAKAVAELHSVELKRSGKSWRASCPLSGHDDPGPSFHVYEDGGAKCFGCHWSGDGIALHMELGRMSFREALKDLAARLGHGGGGNDSARPKRSKRKKAADPDEQWPPGPCRQPPLRLKHRDLGEPWRSWKIRKAGGELIGVHARFHLANGDKELRWWRGRWGLSGLSSKAMPLYLSEQVAGYSDSEPIYVTEGEKAGDSLRELGLQVVATVSGSAVPCRGALEVISGRRVLLWADQDEGGRKHMRGVREVLGASAEVIDIDALDLKAKEDAFDWVEARRAEGRKDEEIRALALDLPLAEPETSDEIVSSDSRYGADDRGLIYWQVDKDGTPVPTRLTNFIVQIVAEVAIDDDLEIRRQFELEAKIRGKTRRFGVSASSFAAMSWVAEELGHSAIVYAGPYLRDHARVAIQCVSRKVQTREVFGHLGWREISGQWVYLHAAGGISAKPVAVEVLPAEQLKNFVLPEPPTGEALREAIRASLSVLQLVAPEVVFPLYAAIWRSVLGPADFALHVEGQTGTGKSVLSALIQQHFGAAMDGRHLPASWSSTANALEGLAFLAKDALLVVDDFAPDGSSYDIQRQHKEAARLLRAQGNRSGRHRMRSDSSMRPSKYPRGLLLSTGEDVPQGHSIRARLLVIEVPLDLMDWNEVSKRQAEAAQGLYASVMAAFVRWLSPRLPSVRGRHPLRVAELRDAVAASSQHQRTPGIVAELAFGMEMYLEFLGEIGALDTAERSQLQVRTWRALTDSLDAQKRLQVEADPVDRFLELLGAALASGTAHLTSAAGLEPDNSGAYGWRRTDNGEGLSESREAQGVRVGWVEEEEGLYLQPDACFRAAQSIANGDGVPLGAKTLWKRMAERGYLASKEEGRSTVRKMFEGQRLRVVHLRTDALCLAPTSDPVFATELAEGDEWLEM